MAKGPNFFFFSFFFCVSFHIFWPQCVLFFSSCLIVFYFWPRTSWHEPPVCGIIYVIGDCFGAESDRKLGLLGGAVEARS